MLSKIIVLGSGLSVLGFLEKNKINNFKVFDKNNYFGGHSYSHNINGQFFDEGAHISHSKNKDFIDLILKKNQIKLNEFSSIIYNYKKNKKLGYPIQLNLKDLNFSEKINILFDLFSKNNKKPPKNYYEWLLLNYGKYLTENYYKTYTKKYWRSDPKEMDIDWVSGRLAKKNLSKTLNSLLFKVKKNDLSYDKFRYPAKGGFFEIFKNFYKDKNISLNSEVTKINLSKKTIEINNKDEIAYDKLISSIPLVDYQSLIPEFDNTFKSELSQFKYTHLITYNFKIKKKINLDFQWCYFYDMEIDVSRMSIINNLNQSKNLNDFYIVQMEVFRRNDEKINYEKIDENIKNHLLTFFKINNNDIFFQKRIFINKAYPIPLIGVEEKRLRILKYLEDHNIYQIGLYGKWKYIWSDQSFLDGYNFNYEN